MHSWNMFLLLPVPALVTEQVTSDTWGGKLCSKARHPSSFWKLGGLAGLSVQSAGNTTESRKRNPSAHRRQILERFYVVTSKKEVKENEPQKFHYYLNAPISNFVIKNKLKISILKLM